MHAQFRVHMLTEDGKTKAREIAEAFDALLTKLEVVLPEGRNLDIVRTKLEEACFFAKKAMAEADAYAQEATHDAKRKARADRFIEPLSLPQHEEILRGFSSSAFGGVAKEAYMRRHGLVFVDGVLHWANDV